MNKTTFALALATLLLAAPAITRADNAATTPAATAPAQAAPKIFTDTINKAIALLEAGKNKELVQLLVDPAEMNGEDMDKAVTGFAQHAGELLKALKDTAGATPKVSDTEVVYPAKDKENGHDLDFRKVNGHWYLQ